MDTGQLYEKLKKVQEAKGYYFSNDHERVMDLLEALLLNKERYGLHGLPLPPGGPATGTPTRTSSAPANTGNRMWPNSARAIAIFMFPRRGTTEPSSTSTFPSAGRWKRCFPNSF